MLVLMQDDVLYVYHDLELLSGVFGDKV